MPKKGQKAITIPEWAWIRAENYFKAHKDELLEINIKSTTGLIRYWILQETKKPQR